MGAIEILPLGPELPLDKLASLIRQAFQTVAEEFHLNPENAPTNPAFIRPEDLKKSLDKGISFFIVYVDKKLAGCVAMEKAKTEGQVFYLERLAVIPERRHEGLGKRLMDHACARIAEEGGKTVSIAIIDENTRLKNWYREYGFSETGKKTFDRLPFTVCFLKKDLEGIIVPRNETHDVVE